MVGFCHGGNMPASHPHNRHHDHDHRDQTIAEQQRVIRRLLRRGRNAHLKPASPNNSKSEDNYDHVGQIDDDYDDL